MKSKLSVAQTSIQRPYGFDKRLISVRPCGVVALDGTPQKSLWGAATGLNFREERVVLKEEMAHYLHDVMGIEVVDLSDGAKSYSSGKHLYPDTDGAITLAAELKHGVKPGVISTKKALQEYDDTDILRSANGTMNYGSMLSSNDFEDKEVGVILGSKHPGDDVFKKWGALMGYGVEANRNNDTGEGYGLDLNYGPVGNDILYHFREDQVLQAILRFGRSSKTNGATVYLNHEAYPEWIDGEKLQIPSFINSEKKRKVISELRTGKPMSVGDLKQATGVSRSHIRNVLRTLTNRGDIRKIVDEYQWIIGSNTAKSDDQKETHSDPAIQSLLDEYYGAIDAGDKKKWGQLKIKLYNEGYEVTELPGFAGK